MNMNLQEQPGSNRRNQSVPVPKHGDFFFAKYINNSGRIKDAPVFIVNSVSDNKDITVCTCTSKPKRNSWDKLVQLRVQTCVRTNKVYTILRSQLISKIEKDLIQENPEIYADIISSIKKLADGKAKP